MESKSLKIVSIICWKIAGATLTPNANRLDLKSPRRVFMQRILDEFSESGICKYASERSIFEKILPPFSLLNISSGLGSG